jgi:hypothetical protein
VVDLTVEHVRGHLPRGRLGEHPLGAVVRAHVEVLDFHAGIAFRPRIQDRGRVEQVVPENELALFGARGADGVDVELSGGLGGGRSGGGRPGGRRSGGCRRRSRRGRSAAASDDEQAGYDQE